MVGYAPEYFEGLGVGPPLTSDHLTALDRLYAMTNPTPAFTEAALGNAPTATLSGPNTVTISVVDQDTSAPLEGALVKLYRVGSGQETKTTDANGEAVFTVIDATWQIGVTEGAHIGASDVIVVPSELSKVVALVSNSITPPTQPDVCRLQILVLDMHGLAVEGATVQGRMARGHFSANPGLVLATSTPQTTNSLGVVLIDFVYAMPIELEITLPGDGRKFSVKTTVPSQPVASLVVREGC